MRRLLPKGFRDLARQVALFVAAYYAYVVVRGLADEPGAAARAFANAREIIDLQQSLGVFVEPSVQAWASGSQALLDAASWVYINAQTSVTLGLLLFLYLRRNESFYFVRNMFLIALGIALVGYVAFPTAPPRFFPEWGFVDAVANFAGVEEQDQGVSALFNPYAAVPSMHVAFALMLGWSVALLVKAPVVRLAWFAYPAVVAFVIVATANHFLLDAVLGAATAGLAALAARELARANPAAWRFRTPLPA